MCVYIVTILSGIGEIAKRRIFLYTRKKEGNDNKKKSKYVL